ncbi:MAG: phosphate ABC transporter permease PstA [Vallitaleaceae bacterium]|nr:phosphate ABC transporter permease PstA [Vallitaleaceae bacterium]
MESSNWTKRSYVNKGDKSLKKSGFKSKIKDIFAYGIIGLATLFTVGVLVFIIGFIFVNGMGKINLHFLTGSYDSITNYVVVEKNAGSKGNSLGLILEEVENDGSEWISIKKIEADSNAKSGLNLAGNKYPLEKGDIIRKVGKTSLEGVSLEEANKIINEQSDQSIKMKITRAGAGIFPMMVTTLLMIALSLLIACPIGIFAAIYLTEYAKAGRLVSGIRFATESLSGIPSIIYGLFGMLFFVIYLKLNYSILAGALTLSIILLPVIIRQTEESLKAVPVSYREGSLGLGATKIQTIRRAVLPSAVPGIIVAIILSIGRIVGESAALLLTAGTVARIPKDFFSSGSTLTVKAYTVAKEEGNIEMACAIGIVVIVIILVLNGMSKMISRQYSK